MSLADGAGSVPRAARSRYTGAVQTYMWTMPIP